MPELPEVESVARTVRSLVRGKTILRCDVIHAIATKPQGPALLRRKAEGQRVEQVERRGKYLIFRLCAGCLVLHFKLDGQLVWFPNRNVAGHVDIALHFEDGALGFVDRRHFGRVLFHRRAEDVPGIAGMGVEPLSREFTPTVLAARLRKSRRPLKLFLLDQTRIAGLGNIYSSEALWRAGLSPRRRAHRVTHAESQRLHKEIVGVLRRALECCLHPAPDFRNPEWWFQGLEKILRVYGREGKSCRRCGGRVRRIDQGGRSTFWCPGCQH
ncbi:MAG: DNA-formamidopyrimidine glycosylase [Acidobacteria bacterium]|nr:DNA-formamidopyrimidine glycosylase [Acidobacteriota bacterium]MBI3663284.1 DNA-formamidopyrimidine glycosylase [Acidobacteriota bacterium]